MNVIPLRPGAGRRRPTRRLTLLLMLVAAWFAAAGAALAQAQPAPARVAFPTYEPLEVADQNPYGQAITGRMVELGWIPGRNLQLEVRSTGGRRDRVNEVAADLVALKPDLLMVPTCGVLLDALRRATRTIPIVVAACTDDMVAAGIVASLARPGGNVTGLQKLTPELTAKRLEMLKELLPRAQRVAVLWAPDYSSFDADWRALRSAASKLGVTFVSVEVRRPDDIEAAFASAAAQRADAVLTLSDPITVVHPTRVAEAAARHKLPLVAPYREVAVAGGLLSYGPNLLAMMRRAGEMADRILRGARPAEMPVEQPSRFDLVVNLKTARALGIDVPRALLLRADEVVE
jgi:putative ABC transport system substrate-binding protein